MNILYLTNHLNVGGITSYVYTLAGGIIEAGHRVYVASSGGELLERFKRKGIEFIPIPIKTKNEISVKIISSFFKLTKIIDELSIQIIHSNTRTTQVLGCLLGRFSGVAHVSTCHGFFKNRPLRRLFPCWGEAVIAVSESVREHLARDFKVDEKKITVIHNGIEADKFRVQSSEFKDKIKKEFGLKEGPVVGIVARLSDVKGHVYLIEAMAQVLKQWPRAELLIVGEGKMKQRLAKLSKSLGIAKNVIFIPKVNDTRDVLSIMDIFVMPSLEEGLGLALMEAMASGIACIGSQVGGIKSLIRHAYNGLLVRPKDARQLEDSMLELLGDEGKRRLLGSNARKHIIENFSEEAMISETQKVYSACVN